MLTTTKILRLGGGLLALLLLAGCSGSGVKVNEITDTSLETLAADHLSAVQLFYGWLGILYQRTSDAPTSNWEDLGDGNWRMWGTTSDGAQYEWFFAADGSGRGTISWPDGTGFSQVFDAPVWNDDWTICQNHVTNTYPDGAQIETDMTDDFSGAAYHGVWDGAARTADGASMQFTLDRAENDRDQLRLELPGGVVVTLRIPIATLTMRPNWPVYSQGATGTFTAPGRGTSQLQVKAQSLDDGDGVWNQWRLTAPDGTQGTFTLNGDSSGAGQLQRDGETVAALRWTDAGVGTLDLLGASVEEVTPSAAACDFRLDKWVRNTALLGPAPVY